jgi:hypothetical protein
MLRATSEGVTYTYFLGHKIGFHASEGDLFLCLKQNVT